MTESKFVRKTEFDKIDDLKNNPITHLLLKKYSYKNKVDLTKMNEDLKIFLSTTELSDKLKFLFNLYDMDGDGLISSTEMFELLKLLNKGVLENWKIQNIVDKTFAEIGEYTTTMNFKQFTIIILRKNLNLKKILNAV